jgi:hypothetical protein
MDSRRKHRRSLKRSQRGFSLLAVILMGLLMLLVGLTTIARSQSDVAIAKTVELKARSLSLADAAAVTYQSLLLQYPILATHNGSSWTNPTGLVTSSGNCAPNAAAFSTTDVTRIQASAKTDWQNIDPQDPKKGQIRLVDYQFQPDDPSQGANVPPGTATLRVEGRANYRGLGLLNRPAISQVAISFRVDENPAENFFVGLWAKDFKTSGSNLTINSNVCDASGTNSSDVLKPFLGTLPSGERAQIVYGSPNLPPPPTDGQSPLLPDPSIFGDVVFDLSPQVHVKDKKTCTLPMLGVQDDCPIWLNEGARSVYKYNIISPDPTDPKKPAIKLEDKSSGGSGLGDSRLVLGKSGNETIILYVEGDIEAKDAMVEVTPGTRVIIYHRKGSIVTKGKATQEVFRTSGQPENLQIYSYESTQRISIDNGSFTDPSEAFIYAPNAEVSIEQDTRVDGAIWTGRWYGKNRATVTQRIDDPGALKIDVPATNRIRPTSSWQQRPTG